LGFKIFVGEVLSGVGFWPFWIRLFGLGPTCKRKVFRSGFYWKLG